MLLRTTFAIVNQFAEDHIFRCGDVHVLIWKYGHLLASIQLGDSPNSASGYHEVDFVARRRIDDVELTRTGDCFLRRNLTDVELGCGKRATKLSSALRIEVDDNGPGIPNSERANVFRPFYRIDRARNQDEGNTGLGLAIARDIAKSHGGDITLGESSMGGLKAIISVPL